MLFLSKDDTCTINNRLLGDYCIVFEEMCACGISIFNSNAGGLWVTGIRVCLSPETDLSWSAR